MRYVIYGAGAVGGVIGGRLHQAGLATTLVARGEHLRALQRDGLTLDGPEGVRTLPVEAVGGAAQVEWRDDTVVLLCVKSQQTAAALEDIGAHAPLGAPVVAVQNGVANERAILRRFPAVYAVCVMLPSTYLSPGVVIQGSAKAPGILDIGRFPGGTDVVTEAVSADLRAAGFASQPRADIMAWKHRKLIMNLGNGVDAIAAPSPAAEELAATARAEGEEVLSAAGLRVVSVHDDLARRADLLTRRTDISHDGSSTWQSLRRRTGDVEIDYLAGEIVLLGRLYGVATPANELIQLTVHRLVREGLPPASLDAAELLVRL